MSPNASVHGQGDFSSLGSLARRTALVFQDDVACVPESLQHVLRHLLSLLRFEDRLDARLEQRLANWWPRLSRTHVSVMTAT